MSSAVTIMNRIGVAIAADSASTITSGTKNSAILNNAQKVFSLGRINQFGVVNVGNPTINGIPVELLIKRYGNYLEDNNIRLEDVTDCTTKFHNFIYQNISNFEIDVAEKDKVIAIASDIVTSLYPDYFKDIIEEDDSGELDWHTIHQRAISNMQNDYFDDDYDEDEARYGMDHYEDLITEVVQHQVPHLDEETIYQLIYFIASALYNYKIHNCTLSFIGYGTKKEYPEELVIEYYGYYHNILQMNTIKHNTVSNESEINLNTLAQNDAIQSFLDGAPEDFMYEIHGFFVHQVYEQCKDLANVWPDNKLELIDSLMNQLRENAYKYQFEATKTRWQELYGAIRFMTPKDLARFANNLIELTSLKRKHVLDDELARTVGGPTDVAIITKSNGFHWIKDKKNIFMDL
jgi:hypothetical protein